jgi:hypothetical protein
MGTQVGNTHYFVAWSGTQLTNKNVVNPTRIYELEITTVGRAASLQQCQAHKQGLTTNQQAWRRTQHNWQRNDERGSRS